MTRSEAKTSIEYFQLRVCRIVFIPPEVIVMDRIVVSQVSVYIDLSGDFCFIAATSEYPVVCHGPPDNRTVFLESFLCIRGAGRMHGATPFPDCVQMVQGALVEFDRG